MMVYTFKIAECRLTCKREYMTRFIELLKSRDFTVCRNAALAVSNACEYEPNALIACQLGALEALMALISDSKRNSSRFATDALESILNNCIYV